MKAESRKQKKEVKKDNTVFFNKVAIMGVGLIGASFAISLRQKDLCREISGFGRNSANLQKAKDRGIIDSFFSDPASACLGADLIVLATPVGSFAELIKRALPSLKKGAIVTDAGSVKGSLVYEIEKMMPEDVSYIGAHPIAGSDQSGIDSALPGLFDDALCIITPTDTSDAGALKTVIDLWKSVGCNVITMDPEKHDRIYASVSHFPHIIAYTLMNTVAEIDSSHLEYCGQGFKDTTRIAASSHELWRDICLFNRENLLEMISVFQKRLDTISRYLRAPDADSLEKEFKNARTLREGIGQS